MSVIAFGAKEGTGINILKVGDTMSKKGWHLNALQKPAAVHIAVTVRSHDQTSFFFSFVWFISDSRWCFLDPDGSSCGYVDS